MREAKVKGSMSPPCRRGHRRAGYDARAPGGPMFHTDTIGLKNLLQGILKYREMFGPMHWGQAPLLVKLAAEGKTLAQWEQERR